MKTLVIPCRRGGTELAPDRRQLKVCMWKQRCVIAAAVVGMALLCGEAFASAAQDPATASAPRVIEVTAKRFTFEPSTIEVVEGERIRLLVKSADGVHGVQIKKFNVNKLVPRGGKPVTIDFVASAAGTFDILCSEECGDGHDAMTGKLVVTAKAKRK
jgi:cytochrome c oxidase subunit 2